MHFIDPKNPVNFSAPVEIDVTYVSHALLHSLGMGVLLMLVTGFIDARQLMNTVMNSVSTSAAGGSQEAGAQGGAGAGSPVGSNGMSGLGKVTKLRQVIHNSSNVLFMCVAIATVIILVGNNIARAFALGAAIALIRFKMKLGESSSGSGLLFGILCGMSAAVGFERVGWILACGYSVIQLSIAQAISFLEARFKVGGWSHGGLSPGELAPAGLAPRELSPAGLSSWMGALSSIGASPVVNGISAASIASIPAASIPVATVPTTTIPTTTSILGRMSPSRLRETGVSALNESILETPPVPPTKAEPRVFENTLASVERWPAKLLKGRALL